MMFLECLYLQPFCVAMSLFLRAKPNSVDLYPQVCFKTLLSSLDGTVLQLQGFLGSDVSGPIPSSVYLSLTQCFCSAHSCLTSSSIPPV